MFCRRRWEFEDRRRAEPGNSFNLSDKAIRLNAQEFACVESGIRIEVERTSAKYTRSESEAHLWVLFS